MSSIEQGFDPTYELTRRQDAGAFARKLRIKRALFKAVGELHIGKRVKLVYFRRWLRRLALPAGAHVAELGSGDGVFSYALASDRPDISVLGVELNPVEAQVCEQVARKEGLTNLHFVVGMAPDLQPDSFDLIYCLDVLEHIRDDVGALREMRCALRPGGGILVHVPSLWHRELGGEMRTIADDEAWRVNPGHVRGGYTHDGLREILQSAGFTVRRIEGTQGSPITLADRIYVAIERWAPLRIVILPLIDLLTWVDLRRVPAHGNTVWGWALRES